MNNEASNTNQGETQRGLRAFSESLSSLVARYKAGTLSEVIDDWRWIMSYSRRHRRAIVIYVVIGITSTSLSLVSSLAGKYLIDIITGYQYSKLWIMATIMVTSGIITIALRSIISRITTRLGVGINNDIQADIFSKIMDADWLSISKFRRGDIINRFNADTQTVSANAINWLPTIIISVYQFLATFLLIMKFDAIMALIAFGSAPFMFLASKAVLGKQHEYARKVKELNSGMVTFEAETFYNMETIKAFGITCQYDERLRWWQKLFRQNTLDYNIFTIKTNIYMSIVGMMVQFVAFGYCLYLLWSHSITYGTMVLFMQQRTQLTKAFNNLTGLVPTFLNSSVSAHRIRELVQLPREHHISASHKLDEQIQQGFTLAIENVSFGYIADRQVISASSMHAAPGEIIALVGASGGGKTTLVRLLLGLIHPDVGQVTIAAADGTVLPVNAETRHLIGYVPQGNTILSGTIADNLRMAREDATDDELIDALKAACAWDFVSQLPDGLETHLGERGAGLSEGQSQRLCIARAILRDAPILILDEATSALDISTERQVLRNIVKHHPHKVCIVTTHRPSVLALCQRVYNISDTHVVPLSEEQASRMSMEF